MSTHSSDEFSHADEAAQFILERTPLRPRVAIILGSGLGSFAGALTETTSVAYTDIPGFPQSTVVGHAGRLSVGTIDGVPAR